MEEPKLTKSAKAFNYKNVRADQMALSEFEHAFHIWVHSSVQEIKGLPRKKYIVSGVTDAFNQLYSLYNKIGIFNGEYGYHKRVLGDRVTEDFREADCIVVSHPLVQMVTAHMRNSEKQIVTEYQSLLIVHCSACAKA